MTIFYRCLGIFAITALLSSCFAIQHSDSEFQNIAPGIWRGLFVFGDEDAAEKIPINFEVFVDEEGKTTSIEFLNGEEKIEPDSMMFWGDTIYLYFNAYEKYLRLIYEVDLVEGYFI